ncbi:MAG: IS110 family transposase [Porticoccaceae bacterium]
MPTAVGIDIAAKTCDMVIRTSGKPGKPISFKQTPAGHAAVIKQLKALKPQSIVMEATGIYYLDLAVAIAEAGLPVSVINPKSFRHFAALKLTGTKTDGVDAALLAEYAERMAPRRWTPPRDLYLKLRDVGRQINRLTHSRTQAKNRLHALTATRTTLALLIEDEREAIAVLDQRIDKLTRAALELIKPDEALARHMKNLCAAKGVGQTTAIAVLAELMVLPCNLKAPQVSRYAGLDIRLKHSGSSVNCPARLSKAGNAYLRGPLYMPAMSAVQHDPRAKAFYDALVARGKKKIQALCAVMRKYLTGMWACIKNETAFDSSLLFSEEHIKA